MLQCSSIECNVALTKYICIMNENYDGGRWGQNIALYIIAGVILIALFIWLCHKSGEDKANLAGAVQSVTSRVNAIEPAVTSIGVSPSWTSERTKSCTNSFSTRQLLTKTTIKTPHVITGIASHSASSP